MKRSYQHAIAVSLTGAGLVMAIVTLVAWPEVVLEPWYLYKLENDPSARAHAAEKLGAMRSVRAVPPLLEILRTSSDSALEPIAEKALAEICPVAPLAQRREIVHELCRRSGESRMVVLRCGRSADFYREGSPTPGAQRAAGLLKAFAAGHSNVDSLIAERLGGGNRLERRVAFAALVNGSPESRRVLSETIAEIASATPEVYDRLLRDVGDLVGRIDVLPVELREQRLRAS